MGDQGDFLAGALIGAAVGAVLGVLFAPQSGRKTRAQINERVSTLADDAKERAVDVGGKLKEAVQEKVSAFRDQDGIMGDAAVQTGPADTAL